MKNAATHFVSRNRLGILLILACAVCVISGNFFWTGSKAQNSSEQSTEKKQSPSDVLNETFSKLMSIAQEKGSVRVIIGLEVENFKPEGDLNNDAQRIEQREKIRQVQDFLFENLKFQHVTNVKKFDFIPFVAMEVDIETLQTLENSPVVTSIVEDRTVSPALQESIPIVRANSAWNLGYTGAGQTVAILDSGVDKFHSFFSNRVVSEACYSSNLCPGGVTQSTAPGSGVNCNVSLSNDCEHGTHVAGIAAGNGASFSGVAKDANIISIQVFHDNGDGDLRASYSDMMLGLQRVYALRTAYNIASANMSIGSEEGYTSNCDSAFSGMKAAIDNLRSVGIATVISSGNKFFTDKISSPACISSAISVGSTSDGSGGITVDTVMPSSNSASFLSLLAPGSRINSSVPGGGFQNKNGTSMAAPHVTGAWAVLKQRAPTASVTQILNALTSTGQPITDSRNGIVKPRIKVDAALQSLGGSCSYTLNPTSRNFSAASTSSFVDVITQSGCSWSATVNTPSSFELFSPLKDKNFISLFHDLTLNEGLENATVAPQAVFLNSTPITIPASGAAAPYPSTIPVSGQSGTITNVTVQLNEVSHTFADDVGVLLVGPTGIKVRLMTDVGGSGDFNADDITFDNTASSIPDNPTTNFVSGLYKPTQGTNFNAAGSNLHPTNFLSPAPVSPYSISLSSFNGQNPNGTWSLYVDDDSTGDAGVIAVGWALGITTSGGGTSWLNITSGSSGTGNGTVNYNVAANTGTSQRTRTITVNGQVHTVTQAGTGGGCVANPISVGQLLNRSLSSSDCVLSGTNRYYDVYSFNGVAGQGIAASMDSSAFDTYLYLVNSANQILDEDNNSGPGTNSRIPNASGFFTLPANGTYFLRASSNTDNATGAYSIALSQCTYSISSDENTIGTGFGGGNFLMDTQSGCAWSAVSDSTSWLTTSSSGSGDGSVSYNFTANPNTSPRTGRITVGGQVSTITQIGIGGAGNVRFSLTNYQANEGGGNATVTVTRSSGIGSGSVRYSTSDGTATAGTDYIPASEILIFSENVTSRTFNITILDDTAFEGNETINLLLSNPSTSLTLGNPNSATLTIIDNDNPPPINRKYDFDGDGKADCSVFRPSGGIWYLLNSQSGFTASQFGISTDRIVPADYDGDRRTDIAVYRNGIWYLLRSTAGFTSIQFGITEDKPMPADFDGDGKAELVVYRPSNGTWYVFNLGTNQFTGFQFGISEDKPVVGDYDGDNRADYAVFRPSNGTWYYQQSSNGFGAIQFGLNTDRPVPADYDGDNRTDVAVYRPSNGVWYYQRSTAGFGAIQFGLDTDRPSPADYDGDGRADVAVFRPSNGIWYLQQSTAGFTGIQFGIAEDKPIPNAFVP